MKITKPAFYLIFCLSVFYIAVFSNKVHAQNYAVGVPVDDSITAITTYDIHQCSPDPTIVLSIPYSTVTGVDRILIINSSSPNAVTVDPGGVLNSIDTVYCTSLQYTYTFYLAPGESFEAVIKSVGIPQIANETYSCGFTGWSGTGSICPGDASLSWANTCTVSEITSMEDHSAEAYSTFTLYPNPARQQLSIEAVVEENTTVRISDLAGRVVLASALIAAKTDLDVSALPAGVYMAALFRNDSIGARQKIIIE